MEQSWILRPRQGQNVTSFGPETLRGTKRISVCQPVTFTDLNLGPHSLVLKWDDSCSTYSLSISFLYRPSLSSKDNRQVDVNLILRPLTWVFESLSCRLIDTSSSLSSKSWRTFCPRPVSWGREEKGSVRLSCVGIRVLGRVGRKVDGKISVRC